MQVTNVSPFSPGITSLENWTWKITNNLMSKIYFVSVLNYFFLPRVYMERSIQKGRLERSESTGHIDGASSFPHLRAKEWGMVQNFINVTTLSWVVLPVIGFLDLFLFLCVLSMAWSLETPTSGLMSRLPKRVGYFPAVIKHKYCNFCTVFRWWTSNFMLELSFYFYFF